MKNLIVNADDLGWTDGVNRGILEAFHNGIVTSTSLLANGAAFAGGVETARSAPGLGVGVHLNLSNGRPVADQEIVTTLLNNDGEFTGGPESLLLRRARGGLSLAEVESEWDEESGKRVSAEAHTRVVNPYGCMVVLAQSLILEHRLALTNLISQSSNAAIIVWKGNQRPDGWEYGVELVAPEMDFWGLDL